MTIERDLQNDAIAKAECKHAIQCCPKPEFWNQFGAKECFCFNCGQRCVECHKRYVAIDKPRLQIY